MDLRRIITGISKTQTYPSDFMDAQGALIQLPALLRIATNRNAIPFLKAPLKSIF